MSEFDENAAEKAGFDASTNIKGKGDTFKSGFWNGFVNGAHWQHDKKSEQIRDYEAALEFYSSAWRADVYTGPSEELLKDFGSMATEALAKWKR